MAAEGPGDRLLGGRLTIEQPATGHRAGTDAILLASSAPEGFAGHAVDLGSGVGAVGLAVAVMEPLAGVTLVEIDPATAALARRNVVANGCEGRVEVVEADILARPAVRRAAGLAAGSATLVLTNPPFDTAGRVRASPDAARQTAHVMGEGDLDRWIRGALDLLAPRGALLCIHRVAALPALLAALDRRFGAVAARPVLPRQGEAATRVLVRAVKGSRAPFVLLAPLVLHGPDGRFTPQAESIHRGTARLRWD